MKIYTFPRSRSLRVLWTLEELGVDYETVRVDMFSDKPKVKSPHSRGKVPLMVDGDVSIEETFAICHYLCNKHPKETFYLMITLIGLLAGGHTYKPRKKIIYKTTNNNILINRKNHTNESHIYSFSSR